MSKNENQNASTHSELNTASLNAVSKQILCGRISRSPFINRKAFSDWLDSELDNLEKEYADFATVNSFRLSVGR